MNRIPQGARAKNLLPEKRLPRRDAELFAMVFNYISKSNYKRLECNQEEIRILDKDLSMNDLLFDLRYAFRQFIKTPGITLVAVVTLALGIGASTGIFTLAWNVILKSLPVPRAWELV
jgi:hypothetical protein